MISAILCVIAGGCIGFWVVRKDEMSILKVLGVCLGVSIGALGGLLLTLLFSATMPRTSERVEYGKTPLVALIGNSNETHGSFFLASGSIGTEQYYKYYYQLPDGGKKFGKIHAEYVTVYEEDRTDAYMVRVGTRDKYSSQVYLWFVPKFMFLEEQPWGVYTIHVPKGTIKAEYKLDLN